MRHKLKGKKLGRSGAHRKALLAGLVCNLIEQRRIKTTLSKAKMASSLAEKMVTLGKKGTLADRKRAISLLRRKTHVRILFDDIVPKCTDRQGGYTRIVKLGKRSGDHSEMVSLEWVSLAPVERKKKKKASKAESEE